jgi:hypothetical protein
MNSFLHISLATCHISFVFIIYTLIFCANAIYKKKKTNRGSTRLAWYFLLEIENSFVDLGVFGKNSMFGRPLLVSDTLCVVILLENVAQSGSLQ